MSEFADSLQFLDQDIKAIEAVLQSSGEPSLLLGANDRTVSVLAPWPQRDELRLHGKVIDYAYGEDHGIWIKFFNNGKMIGKYVNVWDDDPSDDTEENQPGVTDELTNVLLANGFLDDSRATEFQKFMDEIDPESDDWRAIEKAVDNLGDTFGFFAHRWVGFAMVDPRFFEEIKDQFPDAKLINVGSP